MVELGENEPVYRLCETRGGVYFCFVFVFILISSGQQNSQHVEFWWEKIEGNRRRAIMEPSMHFRRANVKPSIDFRKANTESSMHFMRGNTETY